MRYRSIVRWAAAGYVVAACGGGGGDSYGSGPNVNPGSSNSTSITVKNNVFEPAATMVTVGSTVSWTWAQGSVNHNVTFDDGPKSADQSSGGYARVFDKVGTFPYHCTNHPAMTGTVTVKQ
jgi:plastocyanin